MKTPISNVLSELYSESRTFDGMILDTNTKDIIYSTLKNILDYHKINNNLGNFGIKYNWNSNGGKLKITFDIDLIDKYGNVFPCNLEFGEYEIYMEFVA